jgi:hypothetical protein
MCLVNAYIDENRVLSARCIQFIPYRHTCLFLIFRVRCLAEDLDAVKRATTVFAWKRSAKMGQKECHTVIHTSQPGPSATPERITLSVARKLGTTEFIRVGGTYTGGPSRLKVVYYYRTLGYATAR